MEKREMIEKIECIISSIHEHGDIEMLAENILGEMLDVGMLPPQIVNPYLSCKYRDYDHFCDANQHPNCRDYQEEYYLNIWELDYEINSTDGIQLSCESRFEIINHIIESQKNIN